MSHHSLPAVIRSRHSERSEESPRTPPAPCGDERGKLRWSAGRFLHSARSCFARSGRNDGREWGNGGCEWGNDDRG
ncbi:MAG: hypothetical protein LBO71_01025 [Prevotellaceae bacterium]|nr:hypothetical protein [Prevotellaceae bacterium]